MEDDARQSLWQSYTADTLHVVSLAIAKFGGVDLKTKSYSDMIYPENKSYDNRTMKDIIDETIAKFS